MASSADQRPVDPDGAASPPPRRRRPWGWIAACVLLVVVAGGLVIWALGLQSDLDDQRSQTAQAQLQAEQASKEVETLSGEIDQLSQTVTNAGDQLSQAGAEAQENARATLDGLGTKLESMKGEAASVRDKLDKAVKESKSSGEDTAP
jgi:peptidoglycan hydrolase CwlO-like protein